MLITVLDLEREPLEFNETIPAGAIDYGSGIRQIDGMPVSGRADLITEHRGRAQSDPGYPSARRLPGRFEMPCARCLDPVAHRLEEHFDLLFRPPVSMQAPRSTPSRPPRRKSGTIKEAVLLSKTCCGSRCCFPCRQNALPAGLQRSLPWLWTKSEYRGLRLRYKASRSAVDSVGGSPQQDENVKLKAIAVCSRFGHLVTARQVVWENA